MFYEPSKQDHRLPYDPFKAIVAPRPIGWITSMNAKGDINLAPYSYFNAVSTSPAIVMFSSDGWKDTIAFVEQTQEFVCSLATWDLRAQMNATSAPYPRGINEMEKTGLEAAPSVQDRTISTFARGQQPAFAGINTFRKAPYLEDVHEIGKHEVAILGAPFDMGTTYRAGCRFGPQAIRRISALYDSYSVDMAVDLEEELDLVDLGDRRRGFIDPPREVDEHTVSFGNRNPRKLLRCACCDADGDLWMNRRPQRRWIHRGSQYPLPVSQASKPGGSFITALGSNIGQIYTMPSPSRRKKLCNVY